MIFEVDNKITDIAIDQIKDIESIIKVISINPVTEAE